MGHCVIYRQLIVAPERCHLILEVSKDCLGVAVIDPVMVDNIVWRQFPLATGVPDDVLMLSPAEMLVKSLEEIVYDNPVLLSGFERVSVIMHTSRFALLPAATAQMDAESRALLAEASLDICNESSVVIESDNDTKTQAPVFVMATDAVVVDFLRRTFYNPDFHHALDVEGRYFQQTDPLGVDGKMFANFRNGAVDLIAFDSVGLSFANTFAYTSSVDAVYFIMAVRANLGLDASGELLLSGDPSSREAVTPLLRKYLAYVMPLPARMANAVGDLPFVVGAFTSVFCGNIDKNSTIPPQTPIQCE